MTLDPLNAASPLIQVHAWSAMAAFVLGAGVFLRRKGDRAHRVMGRIWAGLMFAVAFSSLFIHTIRMWGPWSPIHLLSLFTLAVLPLGVWRACRRDVAAHRRAMISLYVGALVIAGLFTFVPGRIMHDVLFDGSEASTVATLAVFAFAVCAWTLLMLSRRRRSRPIKP